MDADLKPIDIINMQAILISAKNENKQLQGVSIEALFSFSDGKENCFTKKRLKLFEAELKKLVKRYFSEVKICNYNEAEIKEFQSMYKNHNNI